MPNRASVFCPGSSSEAAQDTCSKPLILIITFPVERLRGGSRRRCRGNPSITQVRPPSGGLVRPSRRFASLRLEIHSQSLANHVEYGREIIHAWVASLGKHSVQALARFRGFRRQRLKSDGRIHEITQD